MDRKQGEEKKGNGMFGNFDELYNSTRFLWSSLGNDKKIEESGGYIEM